MNKPYLALQQKNTESQKNSVIPQSDSHFLTHENKIPATIFLLLCGTPVLAMNNYDDPRKLLTYMDQALTPELDILRVTTKISLDDHLIFEVKVRGESLHAKQDEYILLHIAQGAAYALLIPVNKNSG